jgi:nicotinamidase-related amidase
MKTLIVIDMQNDFITGPLGTPEAQAIVPKVKAKIEEAYRNGDLIIYTQDTHFAGYLNSREGNALPVKHCIHGTEGWKIHNELRVPIEYRNAWTICKFTFGARKLPEMIETDGVAMYCDEIEIVGVCTDICVVSNALLLKAHLYEAMNITVDASCCAGTTPENHKAALQVMKCCQINVIGE